MNAGPLALAASRVAYAAAVIAAPGPAAGPWLGKEVEVGGTRVAARALVARDALIGIGLGAAALHDAPTRPWLAALVASDLSDIAATLADREHLPSRAAIGTVAVAGTMAAIGAILYAGADE